VPINWTKTKKIICAKKIIRVPHLELGSARHEECLEATAPEDVWGGWAAAAARS
jgi:hypothetical protein